MSVLPLVRKPSWCRCGRDLAGLAACQRVLCPCACHDAEPDLDYVALASTKEAP